ncbi:tetraspanin-2A isoform X3 [Daphnia magna]|uniref:tetraspanin-2A isoform X3 n=1 Tax=Daphnia magna TaxID=35525 RepID=UPI001E1BB427|nr:tetraspanin-2A isoform X3 [Daphnia magna]
MPKKIQIAYSLHTLNAISTVLAVVVMALSLWLRYEWDFKHYVYELEAQQVLWTGPYILIAASSLTMATSILGSWATVIEDCQLISLFALASAMSIVLGMAGLAYTLNHGIFHSDLTPWLEERFWVLFHEMDYNERSARILRIIQEDMECCGPSDWKDYQTFNKVLPDECRSPVTGNIAGGSCAEEFALWMEPRTGWLSGIALLLVVIQMGSIFISLWLRKLILLERSKDNRPYRLVVESAKHVQYPFSTQTCDSKSNNSLKGR